MCDSPGVGQNLQDHVMIIGPSFPMKPDHMNDSNFSEPSKIGMLKDAFNHAIYGTNSFFSASFVQASLVS